MSKLNNSEVYKDVIKGKDIWEIYTRRIKVDVWRLNKSAKEFTENVKVKTKDLYIKVEIYMIWLWDLKRRWRPWILQPFIRKKSKWVRYWNDHMFIDYFSNVLSQANWSFLVLTSPRWISPRKWRAACFLSALIKRHRRGKCIYYGYWSYCYCSKGRRYMLEWRVNWNQCQ